jgi:hypothetical protein
LAKATRAKRVVAVGKAECQVIVGRDILAVRQFRVVVELNVRKHVEDIRKAPNRDGFPSKVGRPVEPEDWGVALPLCELDCLGNLFRQLEHELGAELKECPGPNPPCQLDLIAFAAFDHGISQNARPRFDATTPRSV